MWADGYALWGSGGGKLGEEDDSEQKEWRPEMRPDRNFSAAELLT